MSEIESFTPGLIQVLIITRKDYEEKGASIPKMSFDIYRNLKDFDAPMHYLQDTLPRFSAKPEDLIKAYIEAHGKEDICICTEGGAIQEHNEEPPRTPKAMKKLIEKQNKCLLNCGFYNVIFNPKMSSVCGRHDLYIYKNKFVEDFVKNNTGEADTNKIINRVSYRIL